MATEAFLINPARARRSRVYRLNPGLPGPLLSRMMKKYGRRHGMRKAWAAYRKGITANEPEFNPWELIHYPSRTTRLWRGAKGKFATPPRRRNPFGEEVMIVTNPRRRSRRRRKRRASLLNAWFGDAKRHRRAALKGWARRRRTLHNPVRRRRRIFRRNPARGGILAVSMPNVSRPMSLLMPAVVGTAAYIATDRLPSMVNVTSSLPRIGVKAAVCIGGGILISRLLGRSQGAIWAIGSSINVLNDVLRTYVLRTTTVSGLSAFPRRGITYSGLGAYTGEYSLSGYPM